MRRSLRWLGALGAGLIVEPLPPCRAQTGRRLLPGGDA